MAAHRFYVPDLQDGIVDLSANEAHHANSVMRLKIGDAVELFDGNGTMAAASIQAIGKRKCSIEVGDIRKVSRQRSNHLTLAIAIPKAPRQSFLFEKCTELAVDAILPVTFERSVVKASSSSVAKWQRTVIEAGKQCRTAYLPKILDPVSFGTATHSFASNEVQWTCDPTASKTIADQIAQLSAEQPCRVWIGPEGGMTDDEIDVLSKHGAIGIGLGSNILRIETAALAVAAAFTFHRRKITAT